MGFNFFQHFCLGARARTRSNVGLPTGVHETHRAADVFVVHDQQRAVKIVVIALACGVQAKVMNTVMVVARAAGKVVV